jgi:hypothetical protein
MNLRALTVICGIVFAFVSGTAKEQTMDVFEKLQSEDTVTRDAATAEIMAARKEMLQKCEAIVKQFISDENRKGTVKTSILLLGKLRLQESVPFLVEHMTFAVFYKETKRLQDVEDLYPCVEALIQIGVPSVVPVVDKTKKNKDDETVIICSSTVLREVLGADIAKSYLEREIARERGAKEKEGLSRLLKAI